MVGIGGSRVTDGIMLIHASYVARRRSVITVFSNAGMSSDLLMVWFDWTCITLVIFGHYQYLQGQTCSVRSGWPTADGWLSVSEQLCSIGLSYAIISIANVIFLIALCMLPSISYYHIILSHDVMNLF